MGQELKRAMVSKWNIVLIMFLLCLMFVNSYYDGWNTALHVKKATDISNYEDILFYEKYFGNTFRVWSNSYYMIQVLTPIVLIVPYILSYNNEKNNKFRYFMMVREGSKKYLLNKIIAIALSGTLLLGFSEFLFYFITYFFTVTSTDLEYVKDLINYNEALFIAKPIFYFALLLLLHIIYYFAFSIFAVGITSYFKRKSAVIITPFLLVAILDIVLPTYIQPNVVMQPNKSSNFTLNNYVILILAYIIVGIICYVLNEKRIKKQGV